MRLLHHRLLCACFILLLLGCGFELFCAPAHAGDACMPGEAAAELCVCLCHQTATAAGSGLEAPAPQAAAAPQRPASHALHLAAPAVRIDHPPES